MLSGEITRDLGHQFTPEPETREAARAWPRTESPQLGAESFGAYTVFEELGVGGMAMVHRAERRVGGVRQRVALKRLLPNAAADEDLLQLFLDEARLVALLRHRNIAEIYECGRVGDEYFLAMELVAGPTLKKLSKRCADTVGLIPYPIVLNLLCQICEALAYAHDLVDDNGKRVDLVHRDVSPSNIVISSNGVVKLIDFGVAKTTSTHTQAGIIKGKLGYIAPEYLEGGLDHRADLWAVGVVAYEMLTNKRLFAGDDDLELMRLVRSQPLTPPSLHNPDVPPELDAIVMTALQRDPDLRWQNAAAMRNALLGVPRVSSNAEIVEWVEWVFALGDNAPRPVRGTRPRTAVPTPGLLPAAAAAKRAPTARPGVQRAPVALPGVQRAPAAMPVAQRAPTVLPPEQRSPAAPAQPRPPTVLPPDPRASTVLAAPHPPSVAQSAQRSPSPVHWVAKAPTGDAPAVPPPLHLPLPAPRHVTLLPMAPVRAQRYMPTIGAAMIARHRPRRRFIMPAILMVLGGIASALAVPRLYELLIGF